MELQSHVQIPRSNRTMDASPCSFSRGEPLTCVGGSKKVCLQAASPGLAVRSERRGALTVELVLTLPIFLILLVAIVQFGLYHVRMQHVALASRIGAKQAAQTPDLQSYSSVPGNVISAIGAELQTTGITQFCVRLAHNVGSTTVVLWDPPGGCPFCPTGGCTCCPTSPFSSSPYSGTKYVRLTVCVPLTELMPNVLKIFGFDLTGQTTAFTTVFQYEY